MPEPTEASPATTYATVVVKPFRPIKFTLNHIRSGAEIGPTEEGREKSRPKHQIGRYGRYEVLHLVLCEIFAQIEISTSVLLPFL